MIDKTEIDRLRALAVDASKDDRSEPWSEFVKKSDAYRGASGPSVVIALLDALEAAQADAASWRAYQKRKQDLIAAGLLRNPLRSAAMKEQTP